jgi:hypothetical protein
MLTLFAILLWCRSLPEARPSMYHILFFNDINFSPQLSLYPISYSFTYRIYIKFSLSPPPTPKICLSIFCTPPPNKRPEPTSSSVLYRALIVSSWTSSVLDAFKLQLFLAMHRQLSFADLAMLCCANLRVVGLDSPRDAHTERRLTKFTFVSREKNRLEFRWLL